MLRDSDAIRGSESLGVSGTSISVKLDPQSPIVARNIVHEGQHGVDDSIRGRDIQTRSERKATEISAYKSQAIFQKAINFAASSSDGWTPLGGFSAGNINRQAELSVLAACRGSKTGSCGD